MNTLSLRNFGSLRLKAWRRSKPGEPLREIDRRIANRASIADVLSSLDQARAPVRDHFEREWGNSAKAVTFTLKLLNLLLAKAHFSSRNVQVISQPLGMVVDPSNGCNLACPGCVHSEGAKSLRLFDWNTGLLTPERFAGLLERYGPYAMQIMFCNYGEPLTNLQTPRLIEMAKDYGIQTALSSNMSVGRFDAEAYVRSGLDFMYLAIDGESQGVYSRYRKQGDIGVIYRNVEKLVDAKRRLGRRAPLLRWQYLAFEHNAHEIPAALERAKALGVDQFVVEIPFDVSWDDPGVRVANVTPMHVELTTNTEEILAENWGTPDPDAVTVIERELARGWSGRAKGFEGVAASPHTCSWLYKSITMDAKGRVLPCCGAPRPDNNLVFGTIGDDEFNSGMYVQARRFFADRARFDAARAAGGGTPHCVDCEWNQEHTEFGQDSVAQYLRTFGRGSLDAQSIELCSKW